jgi:hypothetical protein
MARLAPQATPRRGRRGGVGLRVGAYRFGMQPPPCWFAVMGCRGRAGGWISNWAGSRSSHFVAPQAIGGRRVTGHRRPDESTLAAMKCMQRG